MASEFPSREAMCAFSFMGDPSGAPRPMKLPKSREKRNAERDLLQHLEPKEKEHQRKKILRTFFSWRNKQPMQTEQEVKFWNWVKSINPDNSSSEDRFKSMSSEFLDKLLDKETFRCALSGWLDNYETSLGISDEEEKTRKFIQFIRDSIQAKLSTENRKREFLQTLPQLEFTAPDLPWPSVFKGSPDAPGLYFEVKCKGSHCRYNRTKGFVSVGASGTYDYFAAAEACKCSHCHSDVNVVAVGFHCCRWALRGITSDGTNLTESNMVAWCYTTYDEVNHVTWTALEFRVAGLGPEEYTHLQNILLSATGEELLEAKKKVKAMPMPELAYRMGGNLSVEEERERLELAASLEQHNREVLEATNLLKKCEAEISLLRRQEQDLKQEILRLRGVTSIE